MARYMEEVQKMNRYAISDNILIYLKKYGMMQKELAEKIGVNEVTMSKWMSGVRPPSLFAVYKIAKALNCTVDDLVKGLDNCE